MFFVWYRAVRLTEVIYLENNSMNVVLAVYYNIIIITLLTFYYNLPNIFHFYIGEESHNEPDIRITNKNMSFGIKAPLGLLSSRCLGLTNWLLKKWTFQFRLDISSDRKECQEYQFFSWNQLNKTKYSTLEKLEM